MARPSEIKAVVELLMEPAEDVRELAKAIIAAVDASRQDRTDYLVCRQLGRMADAYGPYATYAQAEKAITGQKIPALDGTRFFVMPLRHQSQAEATLATLDEGGLTVEAMRQWEIARNGGQPAKTHSRRNRRGNAA